MVTSYMVKHHFMVETPCMTFLPKNLIKRLIFLIFLLFARIWFLHAQELNYEQIFGDNWYKAQAFEKENRYWMEPYLKKSNIPYTVAIAVIFPELVRYSALHDKMEITLLKTLYVNLGEEYANFSIGQFQIKPSFAGIIREKTPEYLGKRSGITFKSPEEFNNISYYRKSIIADLEDPRIQFKYVIAFLKICEEKYKTNRKDDVSRIEFLATAYNYGIDKSSDQIENMIDRKFFNTSLFKSRTYSYSDVSLFWYRGNKDPEKRSNQEEKN